MLNIKIICVGKLRERFYADAANEYIKRLSGYCKPEVVEVDEYRLPAGRPQQAQILLALDKERLAVRAKLPAGPPVIALSPGGRQMDSPEFSGLLSEYAVNGASRLCFVIGGSFGLHEELINSADMALSLSKMTFPHTLARLILLEQLYRAFKISEGGKYHK